MRLSDFDFSLPEALIAQRPVYPRAAARLLQVRGDGSRVDRTFADLPHTNDTSHMHAIFPRRHAAIAPNSPCSCLSRANAVKRTLSMIFHGQ